MKKLKTNEITDGIDTNVLKSSCWASLTTYFADFRFKTFIKRILQRL